MDLSMSMLNETLAAKGGFDLPNYSEMVLPYLVSRAPAMMRSGELKLVYALARDRLDPDLEIVDAGCFLGGSTIAMAAGLSERGDAGRFLKKIHSYDRFINSSEFYSRFLYETVGLGESFLEKFLENTAPYDRYINVYPGDFARIGWIKKKIGLYFCDIAKSTALNAKVYSEYAPWWIPQETLYIQQDFVHTQAPWVQIVIGYLADHFQPLAVEIPSLLLRLESHIPEWKIQRVQANDFTPTEKLNAIARLRAWFKDPETVATMDLIAVGLLHEAGRLEAAKNLAATIIADYAPVIEDAYFPGRLNKTLALIGMPKYVRKKT
jgi:hypothetical protein